MTIFAEHVRWLWRQTAAAALPDFLVTGGVDSGKSTFFRHLAETQPHSANQVVYRYWDLLADPSARTAEGFCALLSQRLRLSRWVTPGTDLFAQLPGLLAEHHPGQRVTLVLDHWDQAQENYETCVHVEKLEKLHTLVRERARNSVGAGLGLILLTRFPTTDSFVRHARRSRNPGLVRISGEVARLIAEVGSFPHLDRAAAETLLAELDCPAEARAAVLDACGGWIGLLLAAVRELRAGVAPAELVPALRQEVEDLLDKSLLPSVAAKHRIEGVRASWELVVREIDRGANPLAAFGLPADLGGNGRPLPAALWGFRPPSPVLLVDLAHVEAALVAAGLPEDLVPGQVRAVVEKIRAEQDIPPDRVKYLREPLEPVRARDIRTRVVVLSGRPLRVLAAPHPREVLVAVPGASLPGARERLPDGWALRDNVVREAGEWV
ncbi:hypothetical protein [Crossiella cryophila]|uniref:NACHT domain-containing protein n=1 Tax=Crossiella cryophila TaxID=43355 RepID=A0A7W7CEB7_9PSEU|nr:hypothetical protein [Crossiella cryophila]MBB4679615.1 hypothetical protein [Crossiella cryophila]